MTIATLLIWVLAATLSYRQARKEVQDLMDGQIASSARMLLAQVAHNEDHLADLSANMAALRGVKSKHNELTLEFQIGRADGTLLARSTNAPATSLSGALGYANIVHEAHPWRSLILSTEKGDYRIQVAQSINLRDKEALEIARKTVLPLGVLFPMLLVLIYFSVRRGLKPLDDLASDVAMRSPENLTELSGRAAPLEARPLVVALNHLLFRLGATLENERRFTADAAHELRTPLAAVKVQAQVALVSSDAADQRHALNQVLAGAERAAHLVEQLLRMARLDPLARLPDPREIELDELARRTVADMYEVAQAGARAIDLETADVPTRVNGDPELLGAALRNLLDNALRYAPAGSKITVYARVEHGEPLLGVMDEGEGVPPEELPRLVERFYRGRETSAEGSGLGLAIVRRIAELHGARLEIGNREGGGFDARLRWHAAPVTVD
jgi:two-component system sensor histidine kinase QseC